ncbi:hypothetical protein AB0I34_39435 [Kribbella sp. NPDC050281]|uniref:hypothetical protein n=1 Tax=Kribbella sp. NPDC050281 TaxID=3155515 RepID=UPI0033C5CE6C
MKHRETREVIVGGVLGSLAGPEVVIAGLYTTAGELTVIGRTVPLKPAQSAQLAAALEPASTTHPWPDEITSYRWGGPDSKKPLAKVNPTVVAEVTADSATQGGQVRHGMRYVRVRRDLSPEDLPQLECPVSRLAAPASCRTCPMACTRDDSNAVTDHSCLLCCLRLRTTNSHTRHGPAGTSMGSAGL